MQIIFDKSFGRLILFTFFGKQSSHCSFCKRKVTQRNLGMIFRGKHRLVYTCCNSLICLLEAEDIRNKKRGFRKWMQQLKHKILYKQK